MSNSNTKTTSAKIDDILNYIESSKGLNYQLNENGRINIFQDLDNKFLSFLPADLNEILHRIDSEGKAFLQLNFINGNKALVTESLIGFKPLEILGLDMSRIPRVVTTPDLSSVYEAIQEALISELSSDHEVEILKKVYHAILLGGERVGILLKEERLWINRLSASKNKAAA